MEILGTPLVWVVVALCVLFLGREITCWYWKINEQLGVLKDIQATNKELAAVVLEQARAMTALRRELAPASEELVVEQAPTVEPTEATPERQAEPSGVEKRLRMGAGLMWGVFVFVLATVGLGGLVLYFPDKFDARWAILQ